MPDHAGRPVGGRAGRAGQIVADAGLTLADIGGDRARHHACHQRADRAASGAKLGLITTAGFRDVLEMGTEQRYDIYDLFLQYPEPLVPRRRRLEVPERMDRDGNTVVAARPRRRARRRPRAGRRRGARRSRSASSTPTATRRTSARPAPHPRAAPGRRGVPLVGRGVRAVGVPAPGHHLRQRVRAAADGPLRPPAGARAVAARVPRRAAISCTRPAAWSRRRRPAPSRSACWSPARRAAASPPRSSASSPGKTDVISFDMGGTTAKACLIEDGRAATAPTMEAARVHRFKKGSGLPIKAPVIDMIEIGAGGGSIAAIDEVGLLRVGPHSAGRRSGSGLLRARRHAADGHRRQPAAGLLRPGFFLGGRMALDLPTPRTARWRASASRSACRRSRRPGASTGS